MKKFAKLMALCLVMVMAVSTFAMSASAAGVLEIGVTGGESAFEDAWELSVDVSSNGKKIGVMVYGFNTAWIDEDYVWTKSVTGTSKAGVYRSGMDSSINWGTEKNAGTFSKSEVTHKTNTVYNYAYFSAAGDSITVSVPYASNVK